MRLISSPTPFPLYRSDQIAPTTVASAMRKNLNLAPFRYDSINNFPRAPMPPRILSKKYNFLKHKFPAYAPTKYVIKHVHEDASIEDEEESWFDYLNPFGCEEEFSENDLEDENFYGGASSEYTANKKFFKLKKWKKKKKKKKLLLIKMVLAFLAIVAIKFLIKKFYKFFPAILAFVRRDELYTDGEHELYDRGIDFAETSAAAAVATNEHFTQHRSVLPSSYELEYE